MASAGMVERRRVRSGVDERFVAEESVRAFAVDKESRWPLQGWCQPHKPYNTSSDDSAMIPQSPAAGRRAF